MTYFQCHYLNSTVELTDERERHITERHPDLLPEYRERLVDVLVDPDQIRLSTRFENARLFSRWFDDLHGGKYVVVVVVSDIKANHSRHWIITAYMTRNLVEGEVQWQRN